MWKPDAYRDYVNSFTLFRGVVLGVVVARRRVPDHHVRGQGPGRLPGHRRLRLGGADLSADRFRRARAAARHLATAPCSPSAPPRRRASPRLCSDSCSSISTCTAGICASSTWRWRCSAVFLALFGFAFFQPAIAATIARLVLALLGRLRLLPDPAAGAARLRPRRAAGPHLDHLHRLAVLCLAGGHRAGLQRRGPARRRRRPRAHRHAARLHRGAARLLRRPGVASAR